MHSIDTRLLAVFAEIHKTRSVTLAADSLGIGQPAVSIALAKLRRQLGDPLFVRTSNGMEPTPLAEDIAPRVAQALQAIGAVFGPQPIFDPIRSERIFRICMTDISQLVLLPKLWQNLQTSAPKVRIEIVPLSSNLAQQLESGEADLALGYVPQLDAGFHQNSLFKSRFVCMVSEHHPRIRDRLSLAQFQAEAHAVISAAGPAPLLVEQAIARRGLKRHVALQLPNYIGAALVVERTDLIITIPDHLGAVLKGRGALKTWPVPFKVAAYDVKQHWHERFHNDQGSRWLRKLIAELLSQHGGDRLSSRAQ